MEVRADGVLAVDARIRVVHEAVAQPDPAVELDAGAEGEGGLQMAAEVLLREAMLAEEREPRAGVGVEAPVAAAEDDDGGSGNDERGVALPLKDAGARQQPPCEYFSKAGARKIASTS